MVNKTMCDLRSIKSPAFNMEGRDTLKYQTLIVKGVVSRMRKFKE